MSTDLESAAKEQAAARVRDSEARARAAAADPGSKFTFHKGKRLPAEFKNPPIGTRWHRCVDSQGLYQPDWMQFRVYKTDTTQADVIYVHAAAISHGRAFVACHNHVKTGVWMDAPPAVIETIRQARRETVDMVTTDVDGNPLGLTGPQRVFRVVEDRPQYNCEVLPSA